jgi:glycosyltransferase involved in cell wall biosynthesis
MLNRPPCGVYYVPDAYGHTTQGIVGRQSAGREFLKAYAASKPAHGFRCVADTTENFATFLDLIAQFGADPAGAFHVGSNDLDAISRIGTLYWPDPALGRLAFARRSLRNDAFSLCGVTHSLSESGAIAGIQDMFVAPLQPWDALICTSVAARRAVENILAGWSAYLCERMGVAPTVPVQLPVIPLGVDADRFRTTDAKANNGRALRQQLGIPDSAVLGLYFGRFNFLTKSHPTPMFMAFAQAAANAPDVDLRLLMTGQFANPLVEAEFRDLAEKYCGNVKIAWVDGRDQDASEASWAAADFFVSLPDNVQETFGMTVLEAMAASLPCVVADWSGLKETVVDGDTGFLVPSRMPSADASEMVLARATFGVESFDDSIAALSQVVVVDIADCASRIAALALNPDLRRSLRHRARMLVERDYDWKKILPRYEALWDELAAIRAGAGGDGRRPPVPAQVGQTDPFVAFGHFATARLAAGAKVTCLDAEAQERLAAIRANPSHTVLLPLLATTTDMIGILGFLLETCTATVAQIEARFAYLRREKIALSLLWMAKFGVVRITG